MADRPRFGPAGIPLIYVGSTADVPQFLHDENLSAFEYQAVRGVHITQIMAEKLGTNARNSDIWITMHGPYFVNLCGNQDVIEKSKVRLIESLRAASWMGAHHVVYHPGYYMNRGKLEALNLCIKSTNEIIEEAAGLGIKNVLLGPETTGKPTQLGSLEEIIEICEKVDKVIPTVDWAHLHARDSGKIKKKEDYLKLIDIIEKRLGREAVENLHCHFTHIEFSTKGERRHHTLDEKEYGPPFQPLAEIIVEQGLKPVIISESPLLDIDSVKMQNMVLKALKKS